MIQGLSSLGFSLVPEQSGEQCTILNTCAFIQSAIAETESNIRELIIRKASRKLRYLVVTGCYPSRFSADELGKKFPEVDLWMTTHDLDKIHHRIAQLVFGNRFLPTGGPQPYIKLTPTHYAYLKISEGCDNWCSFCTIPKIRGAHKSKPIDVIVADATQQVQMGARELIVIAEDTTAWGEDLYGSPHLEKVIAALAKIDGLDWIRLMYLFPARMTDTIITAIAETPKVIPYLDMPIQHCNTDILTQMRRPYTREFLIDLIQKLRTKIPNLSLRTTLILGFPGETDAMVDELSTFLTEFPIDYVGCFTYSEEANTRAARLGNPVPIEVAHARVRHISSVHAKTIQSHWNTRLGQTMEIVAEGDHWGRSMYQAPDVDGVILVPDASFKIGTLSTVTITGFDGYNWVGRAVSSD